MKPSVMILGGNALGLHPVLAAREAGLYTLVTDRDAAAPGLRVADSAAVVDATDVPALVEIAGEHARRFDLRGIYCGSDFGLIPAARVREALDIPGVPVEAVARALGKEKAKAVWLAKGISTPRSVAVASMSDGEGAAAEVGLPAIVKPTDSSGSRGVRRVETPAELREAVREALEVSGERRALVEEFIEGTHHDVNGLFWEGRFYGCGVMDRYFTPFPHCVPVHGYEPSSLSVEWWTRLYALLERAARALGVEDGPVKGDVVVRGDSAYVYEIAPRFHGDVSSSYTSPRVRTLSPAALYMHSLAQGRVPVEQAQDRKNVVAGWAVIQLDAGEIASLSGLDTAAATPGVVGFHLTVRAGGHVKPLEDNTAVPGFVWAVGDSREAVDRALHAFRERLRVLYRDRPQTT